MIFIGLVFLVVALVCFILAAIKRPCRFDLYAAGMVFITLFLLLSNPALQVLVYHPIFRR